MLLITAVLFASGATVSAEEYDCAHNKHHYVEIERVPATETEDGYILSKCDICGAEKKETLFATGHHWSEWTVEKEPTCTEPGIRKRTCNVGTPHSETEEIPALGHSYVEEVVEPTCTEAGKRIFTCSVCGDSYTETFGEPTGHHYVETVTKEPSCGQEGIKTFTCDACGDSYTEPIPALSHVYGEWIIDSPAEAGTEGVRHKECTICGDRITETIPALPVSANGSASQGMPPGTPGGHPSFGLTEAVITGANILLWIILFCILFGEFTIFAWVKRKKKEIKEQERFAYSGEDGFRRL